MKFIITSLAFLIPLAAFTQDIIILKSGDTLQGQIVSTDEDGSIVHFKNKNEQTVSISKDLIKQKNGTILTHDTIPKGWIPGYICLKGGPDTIKGYLKIKTGALKLNNEVILSISFRKNVESKKGTMKFSTVANFSDTLRFFGFYNRHYKYIHYKDELFPTKWGQSSNRIEGWVEIKEKGDIILCKGIYLVYGFVGTAAEENGYTLTTAPTGSPTTFLGTGTSSSSAMYGRGGPSMSLIPMYCLKQGDLPTALIAAPSIKDGDYMLYEIDKDNKNHFINQINDNAALAKRVSSQKLLFGDIEGIVKEYNQWKKSKR